MKRICIAVAACAALAGCKVGVQTDVFAADIFDVLGGAQNLTTPMTFSFEVSGTEGCDKARAGIMSPLTAAYGAAEFIGCNKQSFETFAEFRVQAAIVLDPLDGTFASDHPVFVGVHDFSEAGRIGVAFLVNSTSMEEFRSRIPDELTMFQPNRPDVELAATISNDRREALVLSVADVFADGQPIQGQQEYTLDRRGEVRIALSNVTNAAIAGGEVGAAIASIPAPTE